MTLEYEDEKKVRETVGDYSPCIWLLNPFVLNKKALGLTKAAIIFDQVDHYSLFPDLEGLARKLRRWYKWP